MKTNVNREQNMDIYTKLYNELITEVETEQGYKFYMVGTDTQCINIETYVADDMEDLYYEIKDRLKLNNDIILSFKQEEEMQNCIIENMDHYYYMIMTEQDYKEIIRQEVREKLDTMYEYATDDFVREVVERIQDSDLEELVEMTIEQDFDGIQDLHNELFNMDYFVVGYANAENMINLYGSVFYAIEKIKEYEMDNFGEIYTDFSDSEKVCNMLAYIVGENCLYELEDGLTR
jgi:hypothetical protein